MFPHTFPLLSRKKSTPSISASTTSSQDPSLLYACSAGEWEEAIRLIDRGIGLEYKKLDGYSVLHCAIEKATNTEMDLDINKSLALFVIEKLLSQGLDPNLPSNKLLKTPLHIVATSRSPSASVVLQLLVRYGGNVNKGSICTNRPMKRVPFFL